MERTKEELLEFAETDIRHFAIFCSGLIEHWGTIKRMEINDPNNRDATFVKELVYAIEGAAIPIEVLARYGKINPGYAIEKLENAKRYLDAAIGHFTNKLNLKKAEEDYKKAKEKL